MARERFELVGKADELGDVIRDLYRRGFRLVHGRAPRRVGEYRTTCLDPVEHVHALEWIAKRDVRSRRRRCQQVQQTA